VRREEDEGLWRRGYMKGERTSVRRKMVLEMREEEGK
jgi:hypothetical protein